MIQGYKDLWQVMIQDTVTAVLHWDSLGGQQTSSVEQYMLNISYIYFLTNLRQKTYIFACWEHKFRVHKVQYFSLCSATLWRLPVMTANKRIKSIQHKGNITFSHYKFPLAKKEDKINKEETIQSFTVNKVHFQKWLTFFSQACPCPYLQTGGKRAVA